VFPYSNVKFSKDRPFNSYIFAIIGHLQRILPSCRFPDKRIYVFKYCGIISLFNTKHISFSR
jgi:hypothetical protein